MLHGGDLGWAMQTYGGHRQDWLDLSTGINRRSFPYSSDDALSDIRELPSEADLQACLRAAKLAYGAADKVAITAGPGTQILINSLPHILAPERCYLIEPTYSEHRNAMELAGVACVGVETTQDLFAHDLPDRSCVIVVNPNNPNGKCHSVAGLMALADHLANCSGHLIIDEAFTDIEPSLSLLPHLGERSNIIVLRSFGKFFGLAGLRLGFVFGSFSLMDRFAQFHGPWTVSSIALKIGAQALGDLAWQEQERALLEFWSAQLAECLQRFGLDVCGGTSLYQLASLPDAKSLHQHLARHHIWTRIFSYNESWLRFGIPMCEEELARLTNALQSFEGTFSNQNKQQVG